MFAWKGETFEEYWCTREVIIWPEASRATLIVDDAGDAAMLVHEGTEFENSAAFRPSGRDQPGWLQAGTPQAEYDSSTGQR